jgi:hypothetical protein
VPEKDITLRVVKTVALEPCPPTGKRTSTDYVYVMEFDGDKIRHMTKIWNAGWAMRDLGWQP